MLYCLCRRALCQNAFQPQALMSFLPPQSITQSVCAGNAGCVVRFIPPCDKWLFEDHTVCVCVYTKGQRHV